MQITLLGTETAADIFENSLEKLSSFEGPGGSIIHVLHTDGGRDVLLMIDGLTGHAVMIDGCEHDAEVGGSIHHHARFG